jgi:hypothetical protein
VELVSVLVIHAASWEHPAFSARQLKEVDVKRSIGASVFAAVLVAAFATGSATAAGNPTCADIFGSGILVHGQHIVGDYVTGLGAVLPGTGQLDWPPAGEVGQTVSANGGALIPGGPGPAFHFLEGLPPGASFCLEQAHPNGFTIPGHFSG